MNKLRNIVIVNDFAYINGGASQVALTSALELAKLGYAVTLITAVAPLTPELKHENLTVYCTEQYEILKDPSRIRALLQGLWNFRAARLTAKVLGQLNPENTIIHLHGWTKALSSSVIRVAARRNFKIVCTMHDYFLACPNGGFFNYRKKAICTLKPLSWKCFCVNCDARNYAQKIWRCIRQTIQKYFGYLPARIKNYIAVSNFSGDILKTFLPQNSQILRINNPIDVPAQSPVDVVKNKNFVYIGRLAQEKGVNLFAQAASCLNLHVQFIGDGYCREEIARILSGVTITGWVTKNAIVQLLQDARVLVLPSLWYETQGLVVLEAAALGIPAIVPDTSAAREFVVDGVTGLWFKSGSLDDLMQKMKILQDDSVVKQMGRKAYETYWARPFTMASHLELLEKCYFNMLDC